MNFSPIEQKSMPTTHIRLLRFLYKEEGLTKRELAQRSGYSLPSVQIYLRQLEEDGFLQKGGMAASAAGRKAATFTLRRDARFSVGVEITAFHFKLALINLCDEVVSTKRVFRTFENVPYYWEQLIEEIHRMIRCVDLSPEQVLGIGVALPGIVDHENQLLKISTSLRLENLSLQTLSQGLPWSVLLENDANAAGLAEVGRIEQLEDAVYISLSKGVGGAILMDQKVYPGGRFRAGELGHITLIPNGKPCSCGSRGCLESYCSALALCDDIRELDDFFRRVETGEPEARERLAQYLQDLSLAIHNLHMLFDTDIILGGDLVPYLENYLSDLYLAVGQRKSSANPGAFHIRISKYQDFSPAVGAAVLHTRRFWQE